MHKPLYIELSNWFRLFETLLIYTYNMSVKKHMCSKSVSEDDLPNGQVVKKSHSERSILETGDMKKTINITIADSPTAATASTSTRITIRIEDEDKSTTPLRDQDQPSKKKKRVSLQSLPRLEIEHEPGEFSPPFMEFMELCLQMDRSGDMQRVLDWKLKHHYRRADEAFVRSEQFEALLSAAQQRLRSDYTDKWSHIKEVVDSLRAKKKSSASTATEAYKDDPKTAAEVERLESRLLELREAVQELEQQEVDFEQEGSSAYLQLESMTAQLVRVYAQLCKLRGQPVAQHPRLHLARRAGRAAGPAARLEAWVNAPVADGCTPRFPDFHDVVACVRDAVEQEDLRWTPAQITNEARELFVKCGRALQQLRQWRDWRQAISRLPRHSTDPIYTSVTLQDTLNRNRLLAQQREQQVFDKFENMERLLKIAPTGDDEIKPKKKPELLPSLLEKAPDELSTEVSRCDTKVIKENKKEEAHSRCDVKEIKENKEEEADSRCDVTEIKENKEEEGDSRRDMKEIKENKEEEADSRCDVKEIKENKEEEADSSANIASDESRVRDGGGESGSGNAGPDEGGISDDCEVISSDDSSDSSVVLCSYKADEIVDLRNSETEMYSVSDSDAGSDADALHLLRRVQARGSYTTRVYDVRCEPTAAQTLSSDTDSDSSACVLVHSDNEL